MKPPLGRSKEKTEMRLHCSAKGTENGRKKAEYSGFQQDLGANIQGALLVKKLPSGKSQKKERNK